jgi:zinc-ribbon domain
MTIDPVARPRGLSQQEASVAGVALCPACGERLGAGDQFCRSCGTRLGDTEGLEARAAPRRLNGAVVPPAGTVPQAPEDHPRRSRALVTAGSLIVLMAVAAALVLTLGNSGPTLSQKPAAAVVALLGIVAVWAAAMVIALALCGMAAAGDRAIVDGATEAFRAGPELPMPFANLEWPKGQRKRYGTTGATTSTPTAATPNRSAPSSEHWSWPSPTSTPPRSTAPTPTRNSSAAH